MVPAFFNIVTVKGSEKASAFVRSLGLPDVGALLDFNTFAPFKEKPFTKVYLLKSPDLGMACFLKKTPFNRKKSLLKYILKALIQQQLPHTESFHVYAMSQKLRGLNIAAMDVIAYGESRVLGIWPLSGFALCAEVQGDDFSLLFQQGSPAVRLALLDALGWQIARMHRSGLFYNTRLHDYIIQPGFFEQGAAPVPDPGTRLTLIDLDFVDSSWSRAALSVAHSIYLTLRTGIRFTAKEIGQLFRSYRQAMRQKGRPVSAAFMAEVRALLNQELRSHHADPERVRLFPNTPAPLQGAL